MRKLLLLTVLMVGFCSPAFSQSNSKLLIDTASVKIGILNSAKLPGHFDAIDYKKFLSRAEPPKYLLDPKLAGKDVQFGRLSNGKISAANSLDNMPCLYPQGTFPMPIHKPDSTIRYTLLIKK